MNLRILGRLARATESRGRHAWGLAWIDGGGRLRAYKQRGPISDDLGLLAMARDARLLVGHCRFATAGSYFDNVNNHPHAADGGWFVHNGQIPDYRGLICEHGLYPVSQCDSEVLGLLLEREQGPLLDRALRAVAAVPGGQPLVFLGLWKPGNLVAIRRGNPLHVGRTRHGTYLASLPEGLPGVVRPFRDHYGIELGLGEEVTCGAA